jgi:hypothetical protein
MLKNAPCFCILISAVGILRLVFSSLLAHVIEGI